MPDEECRTDDHDGGGKEVGQISEVAEEVDYAETALNLDNELCADGCQRKQTEEQSGTNENVSLGTEFHKYANVFPGGFFGLDSGIDAACSTSSIPAHPRWGEGADR
jgi:hypothetical protein